MKKFLIPLVTLALATASCSGKKESPTLEARLTQTYGTEATQYAFQVIDNGIKIRGNPQKQEIVYDKVGKDLKHKYPGIKVPRFFGFIDDSTEAENVARLYTAQHRVLERAKKDRINLPISFIIAALCNEGHSLTMAEDDGYNNGFCVYGLDHFGTEFKGIVKRGYLPESFKDRFTVTEHVNELGHKVKSADFKSRLDAFEAFAATLAHRQYLFTEDLKKNGIPRSTIPTEQELFFTYKYFNGGPDSAEKVLRKRSPKAIGHYFRNVSPANSKGNAYVVLSGSQWLDRIGALDTNPEGKYFWSKGVTSN